MSTINWQAFWRELARSSTSATSPPLAGEIVTSVRSVVERMTISEVALSLEVGTVDRRIDHATVGFTQVDV